MSLLRENQRSVVVHIFKIAAKTILRSGISALILLCVGLYFLFPTCQLFQEIQIERKTPFELSITPGNNRIDLNTLMQIDGVERISPIIRLNSNIAFEDYEVDCKIKAVYSYFLDFQFVEGTLYPDSSNMPYLILNRVAAKALSQTDQTISIFVEDIVIMTVNDVEWKAIVCGICEDESDTPTVYMSYDIANKELAQGDDLELIVALEDKSAVESVAAELRSQSLNVDFDSNVSLAWELMQRQCWQTIFLSIGLLSSAVFLIREKRRTEIHEHQSETVMLLLSGITVKIVSVIYTLRIVLTVVCCMVAASIAAIIAGTFSSLAILLGICIAGVISAVILIPQSDA